MKSPRQSRNAFTLIELLVVVAIIGMLMALLLVAVTSAIKNAQTARSRNNAKEIAKAVTMYATNNNMMLLAPDATRFTSFINPTHLTFGGGRTTAPNQIDPGRPLFGYIKDSSVFSCGNDRGYSGMDGAISGANSDMFRTYGTSYIYPINNVTSCGLVGLVVGGTARRLTDPMLLSSSNKVLVFQSSFAGPAGKPADARDRWHDNTVRAGVAGFMDGHADLLKAPTTQINHTTVPLTVDAFTALNPTRTYY